METSDLPSSPESDDVRYPTSLATPPVESICADYLKNELVHLDLQTKLDALVTAPTDGVSPFFYLGQAFSPPPKDVRPQDVPFLRFFFCRFVLTFPLLASAPKFLPATSNASSPRFSPATSDQPPFSMRIPRTPKTLRAIAYPISMSVITPCS